MAGNPYHYVVPWKGDLHATLQALRRREFAAGRYNPVVRFPMDDPQAAPGAEHASIEEAVAASGEEGTRSILDIARISEEPDYGVAAPVDPQDLETYCGTDKPSRRDVEVRLSRLMGDVDRGMAQYVLLYEDGAPTEVLFMGYSYD